MAELFAATGDGVARITRRGDEWTVALTLQGSGAQCLTLDPHHPGTLFVGSHGKGVWKSSDGGAHWQDMQLPQPDVFSVAVSAADGSVYAGCEPSMLFRSTDGGQTWHELESLQSIPSRPTWSFPPRPWTSHVRWIAPSPHDAARLLVGIELGGLMYSDDGGGAGGAPPPRFTPGRWHCPPPTPIAGTSRPAPGRTPPITARATRRRTSTAGAAT